MLDLLIWPNYHYIYLLLVLLEWLHYRSYSQHNNRQQATQQPPGVGGAWAPGRSLPGQPRRGPHAVCRLSPGRPDRCGPLRRRARRGTPSHALHRVQELRDAGARGNLARFYVPRSTPGDRPRRAGLGGLASIVAAMAGTGFVVRCCRVRENLEV